MKPTDKRFWSGEKTGYYPSFKYALSYSVLFSISWTLAISMILCLICLIIGLHNEESISRKNLARNRSLIMNYMS